MAITTRYFGTNASAGLADGTSWANRAKLINAGTWSSVITAFDFGAGNSLVCYIGPDSGAATATAALASGLFSVSAPSAANPLIFAGADSSGNILEPPDKDWMSCKPHWTDSTLPVIATTTNIRTITLAAFCVRLIKFTASGCNGAVINSAAHIDWCSIEQSTANTAALGISPAAGNTRVSNCQVYMSGSSYSAGIQIAGANSVVNCRVTGVTGSSGNRRGFDNNATTAIASFSFCTSVRNGGEGFGSSSTNAGQAFIVTSCVAANNGGTGIKPNSTASQTAYHAFGKNMITGNGAYGIDGQAEAQIFAVDNRLRDNTSGNTNGMDNWPTDLGSYTTDSDDSSEYVDAGNATATSQDYTIKSSATIAGMGFGVAEQAAGGASYTGMMLV